MKRSNNIRRFFGALFIFSALAIFLYPDIVEARRGGFGGFGRGGGFGLKRGGGGFGGRSFGGRRATPPRTSSTPRRTNSFGGRRAANPTSFGGTRLSSPKAYTAKYGTPRRTETRTINQNGTQKQYVMHSYGGYGSGLMTGYLMGSTSWLWFTPFHPAFYYTKPYYSQNANGSIGVYPPTFSFGKLLFAIIIFAVLAYIIYSLFFKKKKNMPVSRSSFS